MKEMWNDKPGGFHPASTPDFLPLLQLKDLQSKRLQSVTERVYNHVHL